MKRVVLLLGVIMLFIGCGNKIEKVREKMEKDLYEKYGEEFVVDRIGIRTAHKDKFYQARIYPKSIIGTNKEFDKYYYASSSINILKFGKLSGVGDSYSYVYRNMDVEKYLLPKAKKLFGERVLIKVDVKHKIGGDPLWLGYKSISLAEMRKDVKERPDFNRIELELYVYIFDRIDDDEEKEERRKQIFEFVQYLKSEGLFEYLEMGVIFIDERVLAPSYKRYSYKVEDSKKEKVVVEGEDVYLPPMELRVEMSEELGKELEGMREEELVERMGKIGKSELSYKGIRKYNSQYQERIYSLNMLKVKYTSSYEAEKIGNNLKYYYYNDINDVEILKSLRYIYIN